MELIARTKQAVRALDNMNYKRMKKILVTDVTSETGDDVSDPGDTSSIDAESNGPRDGVSKVLTVLFHNLIYPCKHQYHGVCLVLFYPLCLGLLPFSTPTYEAPP